METLKLSIYTPERKLLESALALEVTLPTSEGQIQVLPGHAAMIGTLETGVFSYSVAENQTEVGVISTGFFEVANDHVKLMAETLELQQEIDAERAKRAQQTAEESLRGADLSETSFQKYQLKLQRSLVRQQVAGKTGLAR